LNATLEPTLRMFYERSSGSTYRYAARWRSVLKSDDIKVFTCFLFQI